MFIRTIFGAYGLLNILKPRPERNIIVTLLTALFTTVFYLFNVRVLAKLVPISDHSASRG